MMVEEFHPWHDLHYLSILPVLSLAVLTSDEWTDVIVSIQFHWLGLHFSMRLVW